MKENRADIISDNDDTLQKKQPKLLRHEKIAKIYTRSATTIILALGGMIALCIYAERAQDLNRLADMLYPVIVWLIGYCAGRNSR